jgi:hypothetical protein
MDGVGNGANVLAFVILGIQCTSIIYKCLDAIKSLDENVPEPARNVKQLQQLLELLHATLPHEVILHWPTILNFVSMS